MTPQEILTYVRQKGQVKSTEMDDTYLYSLMSSRYQTLWQEITNIDKDYWFEIRKHNLNANQVAYDLKDSVTPNVLVTDLNRDSFIGQLKIVKVSTQYSDTQQDAYFADPLWWNNLDRPVDRYEQRQPKGNPFYILSADKIRVYPKPTDTVVWGLKLYGIIRPYDLNSYTQSVKDIFIPKEYHDLIWLWTLIDVYRERQRTDMAVEAENYYDREKQTMIDNIKRRVMIPAQGKLPDLRTVDMMWPRRYYR